MEIVQNGFSKLRDEYKAHYEDVIAYFLRYPEVMFEGNMTLPIFPEDFNDSYMFYMTEKGKYPAMTPPVIMPTPAATPAATPTPTSTPAPRNFNRGPDVGYQNLLIENYEPASDAVLPTNGPLRLVDLVPKLLAIIDSKLKAGFRPPFIRISLKSLAMANRLNIIGSEYRANNSPEMYNLRRQDIVDQIALKLTISGYVPLGDILFARNISYQTETFNTKNAASKHFPFVLFAHRDICTSVPVKPFSFFSKNMAKGYEADMFHESVSMDVRALYTDVGYTLNQTSKYVVLRCFLKQEPTESINYGFDIATYAKTCEDNIFPTYKSQNAFEYRTFKTYRVEDYIPNFVYLSQSNNVVYINENRIFKFLPSPEAAIRNLADVITENSTPVNRVFQGVESNINGQTQRVLGVAFMFAKQLCSDTSLKIDGYPDLCACIGQGRVAEVRQQLKNSAYRPICHDGKCNDTTDKKVFRYTPTLPCSNLSICDTNITLDTKSLFVENFTINCKFKKEIEESNTQALPPVTAAYPGAGTRRNIWFGIMCLCFLLFFAVLLLK